MTPFHHLFPAINAVHIAAELAREAALRQRFYARRVDEGAMRQDHADRELALVAAWQEDLRRMNDPAYNSAGCGEGAPPAHVLPWGVRRAGLSRELAQRERIYPRALEEGKLTGDQAAHRLDCLRALAARSTTGGTGWRATTPGPCAS